MSEEAPTQAADGQEKPNADRKQIVRLELSDAEFLECLNEARRDVMGKLAEGGWSDVDIMHRSSQKTGEVEVPLSVTVVMLLAITARKVMKVCEAKLLPRDAERRRRFLLPFTRFGDLFADAQALKTLDEKQRTLANAKSLRPYVQGAKIIADDMSEDEFITRVVDLNVVGGDLGSLAKDVGVLEIELPSKISSEVARKFVDLMSAMRRQTEKSMANWEQWEHRIEPASEKDIDDIVKVYDNVTISRDVLAKLDPRPGVNNPEDTRLEIERLEQTFGFLRPSNRDEIEEGLHKGTIVVVRNEMGGVGAFYNVINEEEAVREHMRKDLYFDPHFEYELAVDLKTFEHRPHPETGADRSLEWINQELAHKAFVAAKEGELVWSVDMAVARAEEAGQTVRRNAQVSTACKLENYYRSEQQGKKYVIMQIAEIVGVGDERKQPIKSDRSIMLPYPVRNIRSFHMNETIGAARVAKVREVMKRDGLRLIVDWYYLVNPIERAAQYRERTRRQKS